MYGTLEMPYAKAMRNLSRGPGAEGRTNSTFRARRRRFKFASAGISRVTCDRPLGLMDLKGTVCFPEGSPSEGLQWCHCCCDPIFCSNFPKLKD